MSITPKIHENIHDINLLFTSRVLFRTKGTNQAHGNIYKLYIWEMKMRKEDTMYGKQ